MEENSKVDKYKNDQLCINWVLEGRITFATHSHLQPEALKHSTEQQPWHDIWFSSYSLKNAVIICIHVSFLLLLYCMLRSRVTENKIIHYINNLCRNIIVFSVLLDCTDAKYTWFNREFVGILIWFASCLHGLECVCFRASSVYTVICIGLSSHVSPSSVYT